MPVNIRGHLNVRVPQIVLHVLERSAVAEKQTGAGVPLWYIKTNPETPRNTKGFEGIVGLVFLPFPTGKQVEKKGLLS